MSNDTYHQEALQQAHVDIAKLQVEVQAQGREIGELKILVRELASEVRRAADTLSEARGGWRFMMLLGGGAATFGSFFTWVLTQWKGHP